MKKTLLTSALALGLAFGAAPSFAETYFPIIAKGFSHQFWQAVKAGAEEAAARNGVTITFVIHDDKARVPVTFKGIVPDLFVEGSGAVAEGRRQPDGTFLADNVLAKHDENYVPREMKDMTKDEAHKAIEETR